MLVLVLVLRKPATGSDRSLAGMACAAVSILVAEMLGLLGSPGYFSVEAFRSLDRLLAQTLPIGASILATVAGGGAETMDQ